MSFQAMAWAIEQKAGGPGAKSVLISLANYANEDGECWPSTVLIADQTEQSARSVKTHLAKLRDRGIITWEHQARNDGSRTTSLYRLAMGQSADSARGGENSARGGENSARGGENSARGPVQNLHGGRAKSAPQEEPVKRTSQTPSRSTHHDDDTSPDFEAFWATYPRKVGKGAARKSWAKATKNASAETITAGASRYADQCRRARTEHRFIAHPATWLNGERWTDEDTPPRSQGALDPDEEIRRINAQWGIEPHSQGAPDPDEEIRRINAQWGIE